MPTPVKNPWPQVVLALGLALIFGACAVVLVGLGKPESVILTLAALVAGPAMAWFASNNNQKLEQLKDISNGNMSRRDDQTEAQMTQLIQLNNTLLALVAQTHPSISKEVADAILPPTPATVAESRTWTEANLK